MGDMAYFPAYFSYARTLEGLTDEQFGHVMRAAIEYAEKGTIPQLDALEKMGFAFIKDDIDRANERYKRVCEVNKRNIENRWNAKKEADEQSSDQDEAVTDTTVYGRINGIRDHTTVYETYQSKSNSKRKSKSNSKSEGDIGASDDATPAPAKKTRTVFAPPSIDEVRQYCESNGLSVDAGRFVDYYEANGWMVGKSRMKDWRATARNWSRRERENPAPTQKPTAGQPSAKSFETDDFFTASIMRSYGVDADGASEIIDSFNKSINQNAGGKT